MAASAVYVGDVAHLRLRPRRHALRHRLFMLLLDLDEVEAVRARLRASFWGRLGIVGFEARDHGDGGGRPLRAQVEAQLANAGLSAEGPIRLLCLPRVFGWVFNPISVYFCHDHDGGLAAILYEVSSTFGERHTYAVAAHPDARGVVRQSAAKRLHVSPFMDMAQDYAFRVRPPTSEPGSAITLTVDVADAQGPLLYASFHARRRALTSASLFRAWLAHPLLTFGVALAIHLEAAKLLAKGLRLRAGAPAPDPPFSVGAARVRAGPRRRVAAGLGEPRPANGVHARDADGSPTQGPDNPRVSRAEIDSEP